MFGHLLALPNKIDLPEQKYFTAQAIYLGWAFPTGTALICAILTSLALTIVTRGQGAAFRLSVAAFVLITATIVVFFIWMQPANRATANWTVVPENWLALRTHWEYSHAANAMMTFLALSAAVAPSLVGRRPKRANSAE